MKNTHSQNVVTSIQHTAQFQYSVSDEVMFKGDFVKITKRCIINGQPAYKIDKYTTKWVSEIELR
jgi:hypothetical protein